MAVLGKYCTLILVIVSQKINIGISRDVFCLSSVLFTRELYNFYVNSNI